MVIRKFFILTFFIIGLIQPALALSSIEASVDKNPIMEDEYVVLSISADDELDTSKLDTSALLKDFIVGRISVNRSTQIINGKMSKETRWQIPLSPKNQGAVTIPAFTIDGISSQPIQLQIVKNGGQVRPMNNVFIDASLSTADAYIGQLITYKVKLYLAVSLQRGVLSAPIVEGGEIKQLGEDKDETNIVNGRRFRVIERTYGIIPNQSGSLSIQGAIFEGDVAVESQRQNSMLGFNESRPVQVVAPAQSLQVKPIPDSYQGSWLVSDLVVLKETFPEEVTEFKAGDPITRTLTLLASNTDENSLPDLTLSLPDGLKLYPEKPQRQTFIRDQQIVSQYSVAVAIVPTQAGSYTLPEITVPWWNSQLNRQEIATLPARTINVSPAAISTPITPLAPSAIPQASDNQQESINYWPWVSLALALLWLATLIAWQRSPKALTQTVAANAANKTAPSLAQELKALDDACASHDVGRILQQLQRYFSQWHQTPMTLDKITAQSTALATAVQQLQTTTYAPKSQATSHTELIDASCRALLQAVQACRNPKTQSASPLAPLNPS